MPPRNIKQGDGETSSELLVTDCERWTLSLIEPRFLTTHLVVFLSFFFKYRKQNICSSCWINLISARTWGWNVCILLRRKYPYVQRQSPHFLRDLRFAWCIVLFCCANYFSFDCHVITLLVSLFIFRTKAFQQQPTDFPRSVWLNASLFLSRELAWWAIMDYFFL